jgi:hypothetical protein
VPAYDIQSASGAKFRVNFDHEPTAADVDEAVQHLTAAEPPATVTASGTQQEGHPYLATAARIGAPIVGGVAGALSPIPGGAYVGSGLAGAAGETLAEYLEGQPLDPKEIALQGGLAAIPFVGKARTPLQGAILRGVQSATLGGASSAARDWLHDRSIDLTGVLTGTAVGGLFGSALGAGEGALARRATLLDLPIEPPPAADEPRVLPGVFGLGETPPVPAAEVPLNAAPGLEFPPAFPVEHPPPPSLGQLGLPGPLGLGEAPEVGALSARAEQELAPSIIEHVETTDDVKALIDNLAAQNTALIGDARRGVQTTAQREVAAQPLVAELADRLGMSPKSFVKHLRRRGEAHNAEQLEALKTVFTSVTGDFYDVAKQVAAGDTDPQTLLKMAKAMNLAKGVLAQKAGAVAESGRALNALRGTQRMERLQGRVLEALLSKAGTSEDALQDIAAKAATLADGSADPVVLTRFLREVTEATTFDKIFEYYRNALLTGTRTHVVNNVSNGLALGLRLPTEALAGSMDALRAGVTGTPRQRFASEAAADMLGMTRGLVSGARVALRSFRSEMPQYGAQKVEGLPFAIKGRAGRIVRLPQRMLLAADDFWKTIGAEGAIHAQAYREAAKEGHAGTRRVERMADLLTTDRERLLEDAKDEVLYRTFQSDSPIAAAVIHARDRIPGARFVLPFVQTPINIMSFGVDHTPLAIGKLATRAAKGTLKPGELTEGAAKIAVGTGLAGAVVALAAKDQITGSGPSDKGEAQALRETGWQPYSVKIGNKYQSYDRLEPVGSVLGFAADAAEAMRDPLVSGEDAASRVAFAFAHRLEDQTFLSGLQNVLDAVHDHERFGPAYAKRMAASFIPTGLSQIAGAMDPVRRDTSTFGNLVRSRIPGLSDDVPPIRNIWGEPVQQSYEGAAGLFTPSASTTIKDDPASVEVRRLVQTAGLGLQSPARAFKTKGLAEKLTPEEYDRFTAQAGQLAYQLVTKLVTAPNYQRIASDEKRARLVTNVIGKARDVARLQLKVQRARQQGGVPLALGGP